MRVHVLVIACGLGLGLHLVASTEAVAQFTVNPYAAEAVEHNSDIFFLPTSGPAPVSKDGPGFADTTLRSRLGVDASYLWAEQKFYGTGEFRRADYQHFTFLDHDESLLNAGVIWRATRVIDGIVDYRHERSMVQFTDLADATQLFLQTENIATASANVLLTPDWRLETRGRDRELASPRPGALSLNLREDSIHEALRYLGLASVTAGLELDYLNGKFSNDPTAQTGAYHQITAQLAGNYQVSGLTNFNGTFGYARRSSAGGSADLSGFTGNIGYKRNLTAKTSVGLQLTRAINSYVTTAGSEVDTTLQANTTWAATYRISVTAAYAWTNSKFPNFVQGGVIENRIDHNQLASLEMNYQALRWLSVHPYARYQTRSSTFGVYNYDSKVFGIEFKGTLFKRK